MNDRKYEVPTTRSAGDKAHAAFKIVLNAVPVVGSPAAELFAQVVAPPLEKRRNAWMEEVAEGLRTLESKGTDIEALRDNDEFIDIVMVASTAAIKTASAEKLTALRNSVINTAAGQTPGESLAQMFISFVDSFTDWHLKVLKLFQNPAAWARAHAHDFGSPYASSLASTLVSAYPELHDHRALYDQVWKDLHQRGLVNTDSLSGMMTASGAMAKRTSDLGDQFLDFIEAD